MKGGPARGEGRRVGEERIESREGEGERREDGGGGGGVGCGPGRGRRQACFIWGHGLSHEP